MGKQSKRPGRAARADVHERIKAQADTARSAPRFGVRDADELPELAALMTSGRKRIEAAMPSTFEHEGRTYYVRAAMSLRLDIFAAPGDAEPLVSGAVFSSQGFGHAPGH